MGCFLSAKRTNSNTWSLTPPKQPSSGSRGSPRVLSLTVKNSAVLGVVLFNLLAICVCWLSGWPKKGTSVCVYQLNEWSKPNKVHELRKWINQRISCYYQLKGKDAICFQTAINVFCPKGYQVGLPRKSLLAVLTFVLKLRWRKPLQMSHSLDCQTSLNLRFNTRMVQSQKHKPCELPEYLFYVLRLSSLSCSWGRCPSGKLLGKLTGWWILAGCATCSWHKSVSCLPQQSPSSTLQ